MESHINKTEKESSLSALRSFLNGVSLAINEVGGDINRDLVKKVGEELRRRSDNGYEMTDVGKGWDTFNTKLIRIRPRFIGALGAYATLSNLKKADILKNEGLPLFRLMWFLGSAQDDLIDEIHPDIIKENENPKKLLQRAIFGKDKQFYQAVFTVIGSELNNSSMSSTAKRHLKKKMAQWYDFLTTQETEVLSRDFNTYDFQYSKEYRERQNWNFGSVLVALLNGKECLNSELQKLEDVVPTLSYRTQIIDDIADLPEDITSQRPSYAVGALIDHPDEFIVVKKFLSENPDVGKMTPGQFKKYAPNSSALVISQYEKYGDELKQFAQSQQPKSAIKLLNILGNSAFTIFPIVRDVIYKINPKWANF